MYSVYALIDPRDDLTHYVGVSKDVYQRFHSHVYDRREGSGAKQKNNEWIAELRSLNLMVIMKVLQQVEGWDHSRFIEQCWIQYYIKCGHPLTNIARSMTYHIRKEEGPFLTPEQLRIIEEGIRSSWGENGK